jgi:hypothetical protein
LLHSCPTVTAVPTRERPDGAGPPGAFQSLERLQRAAALAGFRPPPWLALPPLLAISRCLAGSIAAKPRFAPPLFVPAMLSSVLRYSSGNTGNAAAETAVQSFDLD